MSIFKEALSSKTIERMHNKVWGCAEIFPKFETGGQNMR